MLTVLSFSFGVHFLSGTKLRQLAGAQTFICAPRKGRGFENTCDER
jgi:hypothetical protein